MRYMIKKSLQRHSKNSKKAHYKTLFCPPSPIWSLYQFFYLTKSKFSHIKKGTKFYKQPIEKLKWLTKTLSIGTQRKYIQGKHLGMKINIQTSKNNDPVIIYLSNNIWKKTIIFFPPVSCFQHKHYTKV